MSLLRSEDASVVFVSINIPLLRSEILLTRFQPIALLQVCHTRPSQKIVIHHVILKARHKSLAGAALRVHTPRLESPTQPEENLHGLRFNRDNSRPAACTRSDSGGRCPGWYLRLDLRVYFLWIDSQSTSPAYLSIGGRRSTWQTSGDRRRFEDLLPRHSSAFCCRDVYRHRLLPRQSCVAFGASLRRVQWADLWNDRVPGNELSGSSLICDWAQNNKQTGLDFRRRNYRSRIFGWTATCTVGTSLGHSSFANRVTLCLRRLPKLPKHSVSFGVRRPAVALL